MTKRLMKHIARRGAALLLACLLLTSMTACGLFAESETEAETEIPVIEVKEPPVAGLDTAYAIGSGEISSDYALLCRLDGLEAVAGLRTEEKMYPASLTKLMTFIVAYERATDHSALIQITKELKNQYREGSRIGIDVGDFLTVEQMLYALLLESDTDAALGLAIHVAGSEAAFVELMNKRAKELGMNDTHFVNCTGLDDSEEAKNHKTSAYDIALMSCQLLKNHPDIKNFTTIWMDTVRDGTFGLSNTNKLVRFYPGATGLKTGFTSQAGYCLSASAMREDMELVAVVMGSETSKDRFSACKALLDYGFANFSLVQPSVDTDTTIPVKLGVSSTVKAIPNADGALIIDKSQKKDVTTEVTLEPEVSAPVTKGQRLGTMTVKAGEHILAEIPMVAECSVNRLTFWDLFLNMLKSVTMAK